MLTRESRTVPNPAPHQPMRTRQLTFLGGACPLRSGNRMAGFSNPAVTVGHRWKPLVTAGNQKRFCTEFHSSRRHPTSSPDNLATSPATLNPQKAWLLLSLLLAVLNL